MTSEERDRRKSSFVCSINTTTPIRSRRLCRELIQLQIGSPPPFLRDHNLQEWTVAMQESTFPWTTNKFNYVGAGKVLPPFIIEERKSLLILKQQFCPHCKFTVTKVSGLSFSYHIQCLHAITTSVK